MATPLTIEVEVAYALAERQIIVAMEVPAGTTARDAVRRAGLEKEFPDIDAVQCDIGVFGQRVKSDYVLRAGERVEIYRLLEMDPREARRRLAARGETMRRR